MNLRLDKYGNDFGIVDSLGGAKSASRVRRKKRDIPRRDLGRGIRESMDEEAIAELYAGRRYDKPLRPGGTPVRFLSLVSPDTERGKR